MTGGVEARAAARGRFREREGIDLSYVPFVIKASCEALKEHPYVNATFTAEGILRRRAINISVAVALEDGLIVEVDERPEPENDDERRRYYRLTSFGRQVAAADAARLQKVLRQARACGLVPKRS